MPLLRQFFDPKLETVGEAVEFFRQAFEVCLSFASMMCSQTQHQGLQFMHEHHVAHRSVYPCLII